MIDMGWLVNSTWTKQVTAVEPFQSTGRYTGGQWFTKVHFDPGFPFLVLGDVPLDWAWVQLGHPCYLTRDGKDWRPMPERPDNSEWLVGHWIDMRLQLHDHETKWRGVKTYLSLKFLRLNLEHA